MEKILLVINSDDVQEAAITFALTVAKLSGSSLTAVFPDEPLVEEELIISETERATYVESITVSEWTEGAEKIRAREEAIDGFKKMTKDAGVECFVHVDKGMAAEEILAESRFTDLVIMDTATSYVQVVTDILQNAWCPVIIAPANFTAIDNIVFIYDRSKSSVFAIKQFTYLLPAFHSNNARGVYINQEQGLSEEDALQMTDWLKYHYKEVELLLPEPDEVQPYIDSLLQKKNDLVVMGGYGHGLLSSFFVFSEADDTTACRLPIFISHY